MDMETIATKNRKLEQFFYAHGVDFVDCTKDPDGMTVWHYDRTPENEFILNEFRTALSLRTKKGA